MQGLGTATEDQLTHLTETIGRRVMASPEKVMPFADLDDLLPHVLTEASPHTDRLLTVGHLSPDVAIAADRREL